MDKRLAARTRDISTFYVMELLQRAKELEAQGKDIIHMEIGEPDFATPQAIMNAGAQRVLTGDIKYTAAMGLPALREKIAAFYQQRYGVSVPVERIFITPGASGAFLLALGATLNPSESVLMADPCYPCNSNFISLFGGLTQTVAVDASTRYQLTAQHIREHWTAQTKGVLIASPSNPTGTMIEADALKEAIQCTNDLGGCFYSDEIYHGFVYDKVAHTALEFSDNVFVINSFSKYFGMTGWRVGWLIVPDGFISATEKLSQNIFISTSTDAQYAALSAFDAETLSELERRRTELCTRRDFLYENLLRLGFNIPIKPDGAFYIYADCSRFTDDSYAFARALLEAQGVAITPGKDFGNNRPHHHLRFAYTTSIERMAVAMRRLETFLADLSSN